MKQKISVTIDEENVRKIDELLKNFKFRSKSHVIEYSLNKFLSEEALLAK